MSEPIRLQPVRDYSLPDYPTRGEYESGSEPLERSWPDAWKYGKRFLEGLIVAAGLNMAGCTSDSATSMAAPRTTVSPCDVTLGPFTADGQFPHPFVLEASVWTREIYDKGGFVMLGCVAIMPPTMTTEDEAELKATLQEIMVNDSDTGSSDE